MWHIILQILAVVGIILLCILGFLLLTAAAVLFVPIRYRVEGRTKEEDTGILLQVKASWLLHLVTLRYRQAEESKLRLRILGIPIPLSGRKTPKEEGKAADTTIVPKGDKAAETTADPEGDTAAEANADPERDTAAGTNADPEMTTTPPRGNKIQKCIYTIRSVCDNIKNIVKNISYYREVLTAKENRKLYERLLGRLKKILKCILPGKLRIQLLVGTGAPDTTGYLCALYGMLLPFTGKKRKISFTADFENKCLTGSFFLKGKLTLFPLVVQAVGIYLDKQLRRFLSQLKQEER